MSILTNTLIDLNSILSKDEQKEYEKLQQTYYDTGCMCGQYWPCEHDYDDLSLGDCSDDEFPDLHHHDSDEIKHLTSIRKQKSITHPKAQFKKATILEKKNRQTHETTSSDDCLSDEMIDDPREQQEIHWSQTLVGKTIKLKVQSRRRRESDRSEKRRNLISSDW